jgi:DNA-binding CsgD family transcriptional regulator
MDLSDRFSNRERAVIELLLQGKSNKQIAFILHLTPRTIEYHLTNIYNKLGVGSRSEAVLKLTQSGLRFPAIENEEMIRESTVESLSEVHHNEDVRTTIGRRLMGARKYVVAGLSLMILITIGYLFYTNWISANHISQIKTVPPEQSLILSPSQISTQQKLLSTEQISEYIPDEPLALGILVDFLTYLYKGEYEKAALLYGGSYETMIDHNPDIDPNDHSALLHNACLINGAQCLEVLSAGPATAGPIESLNLSEFKFQVEFANPDGSLFVLGPCCGGNETDSPSQSIFYFTVNIIESIPEFKVMDMPPYAP